MNYINGKNLKEFKTFDLTPIRWPTMEWPKNEISQWNSDRESKLFFQPLKMQIVIGS